MANFDKSMIIIFIAVTFFVIFRDKLPLLFETTRFLIIKNMLIVVIGVIILVWYFMKNG